MTELELQVRGVHAGYGGTAVLRDVAVTVGSGRVVALLGSNGAGKTTFLRAVSGLLGLNSGTITLGDRDISRTSAADRARAGLCLIPEGRGIFRTLTVKENLLLQIPPWHKDKSLDRALEAFPGLKARLATPAGRLSGGQQQMLALCRAYLGNPRIVLLDEVSMGLAPVVVDEIFESLRRLAGSGVGLLIVEQYVERALAMADTVYLLNRGRIVLSGSPAELNEGALMREYLGHGLENPDEALRDALLERPR